MNRIKVFLFILISSCGQSSQISVLKGHEEETKKDVAKSEKTAEKFSESLAQKSTEMPKHLMSGFRKSSISDKITVTENSPTRLERIAGENLHLEQDKLNQNLYNSINERESNLSNTEKMLIEGADPNTIFFYSVLYKAVSKKAVKTVALLIQFGANPNLFFGHSGGTISKAEDSAPHLLPLLWEIIPPQKILQFSENTSAESFLKHGDSIYSRYLLLNLYLNLRSKLGIKHQEEEEQNTLVPSIVSGLNTSETLVQKLKNFFIHRSNQMKSKQNLFLSNQLLNNTKGLELEQEEQALKHGANPNFIFRSKESLLMIATRKHHFRMVALLLKYGADPKLGVNFVYPIDIVRNLPHVPSFALLTGQMTPDELLRIGDFDVQIELLRRQENQFRYHQMLKIIHFALDDLIESANRSLLQAVNEKDLGKAKYALEMGAKSSNMYEDKDKDHPLLIAIQKKSSQIALLLLQYRANPMFVVRGRSLRQHALNARLNEVVEEMDKL